MNIIVLQLEIDVKLRLLLRNNMDKLPKMSKDDLIKIALEATKKAEDVKVKVNNLDVIIVGKDETTKLLSENILSNI